jgi:hypothetical protein
MDKIKAVIAGVLAVFVIVGAVHATQNTGKTTICHAAGQEGTTHFVTLDLDNNALYGHNGNAGHFNEDGTPKAGHEDDYFGPCKGDASPSPSLEPSDEPSATPSASPSEKSPEPSQNPCFDDECASPHASPSVSPSATPSEPALPPEHDNRSDGYSSDPGATQIHNWSDDHPEFGKPSMSGK